MLVHTHMQFQKIYLLVLRPSEFCRCQHFFVENQHFYVIVVLLLKAIYREKESCVGDFLVLFSLFVR